MGITCVWDAHAYPAILVFSLFGVIFGLKVFLVIDQQIIFMNKITGDAVLGRYFVPAL